MKFYRRNTTDQFESELTIFSRQNDRGQQCSSGNNSCKALQIYDSRELEGVGFHVKKKVKNFLLQSLWLKIYLRKERNL